MFRLARSIDKVTPYSAGSYPVNRTILLTTGWIIDNEYAPYETENILFGKAF